MKRLILTMATAIMLGTAPIVATASPSPTATSYAKKRTGKKSTKQSAAIAGTIAYGNMTLKLLSNGKVSGPQSIRGTYTRQSDGNYEVRWYYANSDGETVGFIIDDKYYEVYCGSEDPIITYDYPNISIDGPDGYQVQSYYEYPGYKVTWKR